MAIFILKYVCTGRHTVFPRGTVCLFEFREDICEREREDVDNMNLSEFFTENPQVAIAFSGGVDSAYLLYAAFAVRGKSAGLIM